MTNQVVTSENEADRVVWVGIPVTVLKVFSGDFPLITISPES